MADAKGSVVSTIPEKYYQYPYSQSPLPTGLQRGLYAPGLLGLFSTISTILLLVFIVYRFTTWQRHYRT